MDTETTSVKEGSAEILFEKDKVFYNVIQEFNRDMSIAAIKVWSELFLSEKRIKKRKTVATVALEKGPEKEPKVMNERQKAKKNQQLKSLKKAADSIKYDKVDVTEESFDGYSFTVLEALAASGLRSIRYAKEIPRISKILTNDLSVNAVASIARNSVHNKVDAIITPQQGDACQAFYKALANNEKYDVVDLDPYGSATPFLDAAIQVVSDGGLLCVTCTDLAVLAGSQPESCFGKYGGLNIPNAPYTHEMALRILLHSIQSTAAKYKLGIEVLLSCHIDYYVRVFVRVRHSAVLMKEASSKTALVNACQTCNSYQVQPLGKLILTEKGRKYGPAQMTMESKCAVCTQKTHIGGPFYCNPIHSPEFIARMIGHVVDNEGAYGTWDRMAGMLMVMSEELHEACFYYVLPKLCNVVHCETPPLAIFVSGLLSTGFKVSQSHACPQAIKTNAPPEIVWDVVRHWVKLHPIKRAENENTPSYKILSVEPTIAVDFTKRADSEAPSTRFNLVRFQDNPTAFWGPMSRPGKDTKPVGQVKKEKRIYVPLEGSDLTAKKARIKDIPESAPQSVPVSESPAK